jgi:hypothetical protein
MEEKQIPAFLRWPGGFRPGTHTDRFDMEYALEELELEESVKSKIVATLFESEAAIYKARAAGAARIAELLGGSGKAG